MRAVLIILTMLATTRAWAEWVQVTKSAKGVYYADPTTLRKDGDLRKIWILYDKKERDQNGALSTLWLWWVDCKGGDSSRLSTITRTGPMATGTILRKDDSRSDWSYSAPNTIGAKIHNHVCGAIPGNSRAKTVRPSAPTTSASKSDSMGSSAAAIPLLKQGGTLVVPVLLNNAITLNFIVDSGAADVSIPSDVVKTLMRTGTLKQADFLGKRTYVLADGSKVSSETFRIRSMKVGDRIVENVTGSVTHTEGVLLLGQSFLGRFKSWSIDNAKQALLLE